MKVDGFKLYCESFRELFPNAKSSEVSFLSPGVLDHMVEKFQKDALHLLEVCRGCDLWSDAWPAWGEGNEAHGVKITMQTSVAEVVDAFLEKHKPDAAHDTPFSKEQP